MIQSVTQYDLMSTSTCTPPGAGASTCVYQYRKEISTTTQNISTSTQNYEFVSTVEAVFTIGIVFAVLVAYVVKKLT